MRRLDPDFQEAIAAEYLLGVLRGAARRRLEAMRREDLELDRVIDLCETRFAALGLGVPALEPTPAFRHHLRQKLGIADLDRPQSASRTRIWFPVFAVAAVVVLALVLTWRALIPPPVPRPPMAVSLIRSPTHRTIFVAVVSAGARSVLIYPVGQPSIPSGRTLELWALEAAHPPVPIGFFAKARRGYRYGMPRAARLHLVGLAFSVEPPGGSPRPYPTGPIIGRGPMTLLAATKAHPRIRHRLS
jgi:anti-sigma-K factor RskA